MFRLLRAGWPLSPNNLEMNMRVFSTFPFSEAINKQVGEYVALGGKPRKVLEIVRQGRNEPYFRLEGVDPYYWLCQDAPGLISWQVLGNAV